MAGILRSVTGGKGYGASADNVLSPSLFQQAVWHTRRATCGPCANRRLTTTEEAYQSRTNSEGKSKTTYWV